jgi:hypothetical protein
VRCLRAMGMHYRIEMFSHASKRVAQTVPKLIAKLNGASSGGPWRKGRGVDRRSNIETKLRLSSIVVRQYALDEHDKMLEDL